MEAHSVVDLEEFSTNFFQLLTSLEAIATTHTPVDVVRPMVVHLSSPNCSLVASTLKEQLMQLTQLSSLLLEIVQQASSPESESSIIVDPFARASGRLSIVKS